MKKILIILCIAICNNANADTTGVYKILLDHDIKHPKIVMAQICLESGNMECKDCSWSNNNNPFGFFYKGKYLNFCTLYEAVEYYKSWQDKLYKGGDYYHFLKRVGYATDPNYIKKIKQIVGNMK